MHNQAYVSQVTTWPPAGQHSIHHTSYLESVPVSAQVTYDVVTTVNHAAVERHFDSNGTEVRLSFEVASERAGDKP